MDLVTGATGNIGTELIQALTIRGRQVHALTRGSRPAALPEGVHVVTGDLDDPDSLTAALADVDGVFRLAGYADMTGLLTAIRAAKVQRVVLLWSGAVAGGDEHNAIVRYNTGSEAAVRASGLDSTILQPSGFMSNALRWVPQLRYSDTISEPFADVAVAAIDTYDIAAVAALALTESGHHGAIYRLTGPEAILPADRVRILALGRDLRLQPLSNAEARAQMSTNMPGEYVDAFFNFFVEGTYGDSQVHPTVADRSAERRLRSRWRSTPKPRRRPPAPLSSTLGASMAERLRHFVAALADPGS